MHSTQLSIGTRIGQIKKNMADGFDTLLHPKLSKQLQALDVRAPTMTVSKNCSGWRTIFDIPRFGIATSQIPNVSPRDIGNLPIHEATGLFKSKLFIEEKNIPIRLPLQSVQAISGSKSDLTMFKTVFEFGEKNYRRSREYYASYTELQYFEHCLEDGYGEGGSHFECNLYAPMIRWQNSGGSHRLSTAHYMAMKEDKKTVLDAKIDIISINFDWLDEMLASHDAYLMETDDYFLVREAFGMTYDGGTGATMVVIAERNRYSNCDAAMLEAETFDIVLLIVSRSARLPRILREWLMEKRRGKYLTNFSELVIDFKDTEVESRRLIHKMVVV